MVRLKMGAMKKVKIVTIVFSIFLIGCFASTWSSKPRSEPDGFRGIRWGAEISTLKGMEKAEQDRSSNSDLIWYTRKGETLAIGKATLGSIFYSFWMGNFEGVWIDFKGDENFEALKKELFEQFGKALESEELMKKTYERAWRGPSTIERADFFMVGGAKIQRCHCHIPRIAIWEPSISIPESLTRKEEPMKNKRKKKKG